LQYINHVNPVVTVENVSLAEAQLLMLKNNVAHLCNRRYQQIDCKGVISEHDLIVAQASNPGVLIKEIKRAQTSERTKTN
jgi:CBS domain-containing protein